MVKIKRLRIKVTGIVQGVGFRPFVRNLAVELGICGSVCNMGPYVEIVAESGERQLAAFLRLLREKAPPRAQIRGVETAQEAPGNLENFTILHSAPAQGQVLVPPDIAVCEQCVRELYDPRDRRYLHPFINCTACGPRLTILDRMPYDRERTSMKEFPMCSACGSEYRDPSSRRYHAQPVCCPDCGPKVYLLDPPLKGDAIARTRDVIRGGGIAAVKGIGGFHLCCDAANPVAVVRLRRLKNRPYQPFAVMAKDRAALERECRVEPAARPLLEGPEKPIVLLPKSGKGRVCEEVAPLNPMLGVMLPYTPLHLLLFDNRDGKPFPDCLVVTSGNRSGSPICITDAEAMQFLAPLCECILSHDRSIRLRCDDSVVSLYRGRPYMLRRSRGYAPLPVTLPGLDADRVLAVGGELKNAFCLARGGQFYLSPHVGDLSDARAAGALGAACRRLADLLVCEPKTVACDLHPGYNSTAYAQGLRLPVIRVQHHFAHIASCMAENGLGPRDEVIGVAFDGTGYGTDGTVWGGEFLRASYRGFERLGSLEPFPLAGGDRAVREGWRPAVPLLTAAMDGDREAARALALRLCLCEGEEFDLLCRMLGAGVNCVTTTSAGRLFDAVSALLGLKRVSTFEGEAAAALEFEAERCSAAERKAQEALPFRLLPADGGGKAPFRIEVHGVFGELAKKALRGVPTPELASLFHLTLAAMTEAACLRCRERTGIGTVALSGGVFANRLLLGLCEERLEARGFKVLTHSMVPPNDGGIALGQAAVAAAAGAAE